MLRTRKAPRGVTLIELIVGMMLVAIALSLIVPSGQTTKDAATTKVTAEELVARFRQARQSALAKSVPVAVTFPITDSISHTDEGYFLEGEVDPKVSQRWKINQQFPETVYFVGTWSGPSWTTAPIMETAHKNFDPDTWFESVPPPKAATFIFTPSGNLISSEKTADGKYRIAVGFGVTSSGKTLTSIDSPYTLWASPSGEVGLEKGLYKGDVSKSNQKSSAPVAQFVPLSTVANRAPTVEVIGDNAFPGAQAYPNSVNPKTNNGNSISVDAVLTLELHVKDKDGDPPYFRWRTVEASRLIDDKGNFKDETNMERWGGRFANEGEVRMEWDAEKRLWVGRDTWAPAPEDLGGNRYKLVCEVRDRKGGVVETGFPIDGHYLVTTNEPWILYKTWNEQNRSELWKMTREGAEHTLVCSFPHQDVHYGQWSPSGAEVIVGATDGVYRVSADGTIKKKVVDVDLEGGTLDGCCLSPEGDAIFYAYGKEYNKKIRKVYIDGSGIQRTIPLAPEPPESGGFFSPPPDPNPLRRIGPLYDLSAAKFGSMTILIATYWHYNRDSGFLGTGLFRKKKRRKGAFIINADTGDALNYDKPRSWDGVGQTAERPPYGISFAKTDDPLSLEGIHILYGSANGVIHINRVASAGTPLSTNFVRDPNPVRTLSTGLTDVHHPKYADPEAKSMVFVAGRNKSAKIYYMPDINNPGNWRELEIPSITSGAEQPSVSRPRLRD